MVLGCCSELWVQGSVWLSPTLGCISGRDDGSEPLVSTDYEPGTEPNTLSTFGYKTMIVSVFESITEV